MIACVTLLTFMLKHYLFLQILSVNYLKDIKNGGKGTKNVFLTVVQCTEQMASLNVTGNKQPRQPVLAP